MTLDSVYTFPFDRWLNAGSALKHIVVGWQLAGIVGVANGLGINVVQPSTYLCSPPDYAGGDPYLNVANRLRYLNPAAFVRVPVNSANVPIRAGSLGMNA